MASLDRMYEKNNSGFVDSILDKLNEDCTKQISKSGTNSKQSVPCIYRIPEELRTLNKDAYSPRLVSIGPRYWVNLQAMEEHKVNYMHRLFRRTKKSNDTIREDVVETLQSCVDAMMKEDGYARACYEESFLYLNKQTFAETMLVDGCFILELLYRSQLQDIDKTGDPIFGKHRDLKHDLLVPENQIPFSVLKKLFDHTVKNIPNRPRTNLSLQEYIIGFFDKMNLKCDIRKKGVVTGDHILDTLHKNYLLEPGEANNNKNDDLEAGKGKYQEDMKSYYSDDTADHPGKRYKGYPINEPAYSREDHPALLKYSATELDRAGVKFQAGERGVLDMSFNTSSIFPWLPSAIIPKQFPSWFFYCCGTTTFKISPLCIDHSTETILMSLIAYERSNRRLPQHVTSYAVLMNTLLNSKDDVQVLVKAKVLQKYEGVSEEALQLFNNVCKNVFLEEEDLYFSKACNGLQDYLCHFENGNLPSMLKRNCVTMVSYFCSSRWAVISIIGALFLFALQVLQTVYTIRSSS